MFAGVGSYVLYETSQSYKRYHGIRRTAYLAFGIGAFVVSMGLAVARLRYQPPQDTHEKRN